MCTHCGCGSQTKTRFDLREVDLETDVPPDHTHTHCHCHDHGHDHSHSHSHDHGHHHHHHDHPPSHGHTHAPQEGINVRAIRIEQDILARNDAFARVNRGLFQERGILALNLVSSPGSGKTTLLVETIRRLKDRVTMAVIEGDQQTDFDAQRIRETGIPALQINTGKGCHLDARMVGEAARRLEVAPHSLLMIENVGNLVCPASFDLGEGARVVILSVTEGEDKPLKYPDMFAASTIMILSKTDLLPHVPFDPARAMDYARRVNPDLQVFQLSTTTGAGFDAWVDWVLGQMARG